MNRKQLDKQADDQMIAALVRLARLIHWLRSRSVQ